MPGQPIPAAADSAQASGQRGKVGAGPSQGAYEGRGPRCTRRVGSRHWHPYGQGSCGQADSTGRTSTRVPFAAFSSGLAPVSAATAAPRARTAKIAAGLRKDMEPPAWKRLGAGHAGEGSVALSRGRAGRGSSRAKFRGRTGAWPEPARWVAGYGVNPPLPAGYEVVMARCETCGNDYDKAFQVVTAHTTACATYSILR